MEVIKTTPYKYGYHLDKMTAEKIHDPEIGTKYIVYMDGKRMEINTLQVEFHDEKKLTKDKFNERVKGTKGVYRLWGEFEGGWYDSDDLTKEDIESLGFEYVKIDTEDKSGFTASSNSVAYPFETWELGEFSPADDYTKLIWYTNSNYIHIYSNVHYVGDPSFISTVFSGKLKNKSELIKLLQQIGIRTKGNEE